jgi:hypothetical protein
VISKSFPLYSAITLTMNFSSLEGQSVYTQTLLIRESISLVENLTLLRCRSGSDIARLLEVFLGLARESLSA